MPSSFRPAASPAVSAQLLEGEVGLYDLRTDSVRLLNPQASVIWQLCDGERTVSEIVSDVAVVYEVPDEVVEPEVRRMLGEFAADRLITAPD